MRRARAGLAAVLALGACAAVAADMARFVDRLPRTPAAAAPDAEAIVVLTGGSGRLEAGLAALAAAPGATLLVSGVHPATDLDGLAARAGLDPAFARGRIVLDRAAADTRGNARETARWAASRGVARLALVTAAYHMPRAEAEFRRAMPGVEIVPHPVFPPHVMLDSWWRYGGTTRLLFAEYLKFRLAQLRP